MQRGEPSFRFSLFRFEPTKARPAEAILVSHATDELMVSGEMRVFGCALRFSHRQKSWKACRCQRRMVSVFTTSTESRQVAVVALAATSTARSKVPLRVLDLKLQDQQLLTKEYVFREQEPSRTQKVGD